MAKQLMIYEEVVPISPERHKDMSVEMGPPYDFAREVRTVPLVAEEILMAAREYTVVFAVTDKEGGVTPFVILGVKDNENLYVTPEGEWTAKYIPAFIRRYPFVFSSQDQKQFVLCIDESFQGCNKEGRGQRLFDDEGNKTEFVDNLLKFNENYQRSALRTTLFCKKLQELELLDAKEAQLAVDGGETIKLTGFMVVNREKLNALPPETLSEMAKSGALELSFAQLLSMHNLGITASRHAERRSEEALASKA